MATQKEKIVRRITELENLIAVSTAEMDSLKDELSTTPGALLDRDEDAFVRSSIDRKNEFLRKSGFLPTK